MEAFYALTDLLHRGIVLEKEIKYVLGEMDELVHQDHFHSHSCYERVHLLFSRGQHEPNPNLPCNMSFIMILLATQYVGAEVENKVEEALEEGKIEKCNEVTLQYLLLLPKLKVEGLPMTHENKNINNLLF